MLVELASPVGERPGPSGAKRFVQPLGLQSYGRVHFGSRICQRTLGPHDRSGVVALPGRREGPNLLPLRRCHDDAGVGLQPGDEAPGPVRELELSVLVEPCGGDGAVRQFRDGEALAFCQGFDLPFRLFLEAFRTKS
jgi:hypothetical protein